MYYCLIMTLENNLFIPNCPAIETYDTHAKYPIHSGTKMIVK